ncbi:MAG: transposase domain-containing protein [Alphaproteobacteria bacterium]|nr:MAG: transposase domain-containing protein [Alphaproteobacteria bacterium]
MESAKLNDPARRDEWGRHVEAWRPTGQSMRAYCCDHHLSVIETAKLNGVEPYEWLRSTLETMDAGHPMNRVEKLLPWALRGVH